MLIMMDQSSNEDRLAHVLCSLLSSCHFAPQPAHLTPYIGLLQKFRQPKALKKLLDTTPVTAQDLCSIDSFVAYAMWSMAMNEGEHDKIDELARLIARLQLILFDQTN